MNCINNKFSFCTQDSQYNELFLSAVIQTWFAKVTTQSYVLLFFSHVIAVHPNVLHFQPLTIEMFAQ